MAKGRYKAVRQRGERRSNPPVDPQKVWIIAMVIVNWMIFDVLCHK